MKKIRKPSDVRGQSAVRPIKIQPGMFCRELDKQIFK